MVSYFITCSTSFSHLGLGVFSPVTPVFNQFTYYLILGLCVIIFCVLSLFDNTLCLTCVPVQCDCAVVGGDCRELGASWAVGHSG